MSTPPRTLRARTPEDVLAVVPLVLGFVPGESVVMLTFGSAKAFHARVDLPPDPDDLAEMVDLLVEPALRHGVDGVVLVVYTAGRDRADAALDELQDGLEEAGITLLEALHADGEQWFALLPGRPDEAYVGTPYDLAAHPFIAQAVLEGTVTHGSREELAATLVEDDPERRRPVAERLAQLGPPSPGQREAEAAWLAATTRRHVDEETVPEAGEVARMLVAVSDPEVRDAAWVQQTRADAVRHVRLWTAVLRPAPDDLVPGAAAVLGFAAWLAGHGALAWCAVDRCLEVDPGHSLGSLVAGMLADAVAPSLWTSVGEDVRREAGRAGEAPA